MPDDQIKTSDFTFSLDCLIREMAQAYFNTAPGHRKQRFEELSGMLQREGFAEMKRAVNALPVEFLNRLKGTFDEK